MDTDLTKNTSIQTTCPYCGVGCGMEVNNSHIQKIINRPQLTSTLNDIQVKVVGDKLHPANFGKLCVKGSSAGETVDFDGRMMQPQIKGRDVSWKTAIETVANTFSQVVQEHGPDSVAFYVSGQLLTEDYYVANKLIKGFIGTANIDTNSRLCMASAVVGYKRAFGSDTVPCSYEDLELADLIIMVGSNAAWAHPIVYQRIAAAKKKRPDMKVVVVDPRQTATCDIADLHLNLKPGTDAILFNGILSQLAGSKARDQGYIDTHTQGFESALFEAQKQQSSISDVAEQCELEEGKLHQLIDWVIEREKMVTLYSQGVNQSSSGVDKSNAIINCHLATGRIGRAGMGPFSITGQPNAMGGREVGGLANQLAAHMDFNKPESIDRVSRFWNATNMAQENGLKAIDMFQAVADKKIKAIWIMNTNPVVSMPNADAVKQALKECELVVVSDCEQHTDTTEVADILLPALTWGETDGTVTNSDRTVSRQRQFMPGPEQAKPDWWMVTQVARKMGFESEFGFESAADIFREHAALSGFENQGSRDFDLSLLQAITESEYAHLKPFQWPLNKQHPTGTKRMFADGHFYTASGKAQFIAIKPRLPENPTTVEHPFVFNTGRVRDQWHTMTRTAKTPRLMSHTDEPYVMIHPKDAKTHQVQEGQLAKVENELGLFIGRVKLDTGQRQGSLFAPMHWTSQYASHGRVDTLVKPVSDPLSGQPESKHTPVKISPYVASWHGFILSREPLNTEGLEYWVKIKGKQFYRYEMAGERPLEQLQYWANQLLGVSEEDTDMAIIEYTDASAKRYRSAWLKENKLQAVLFTSPTTELPPRSWLGSLFAEKEIKGRTRQHLLAGQKSGVKDEGKVICSCFGVGMNTIIDAITDQKLASVEVIGQALKAGTNCGSCVPEIQAILAKELVTALDKDSA